MENKMDNDKRDLKRKVEPEKVMNLLRKLWNCMTGWEKRRLIAASIALVLSSSSNLSYPSIMGKALDFALKWRRPRETVMVSMISALAIMGIGCLSSFFRVYYLQLVASNFQSRIRKRIFSNILSKKLEDTDRIPSEESFAALGNDAETTANIVTLKLAAAIRSCSSTIGATTMLFRLSPKLTLGALCLVPVIGAGAITYSRYAKRVAAVVKNTLSGAIDTALEKIHNIRHVRLFGREKWEIEHFSTSLDSLQYATRSMCRIEGILMGGLALAGNLSVLMILYYGAILVRNHELSVGSLTSFCLYSGMLGLGCSGLMQVYSEIAKNTVCVERVLKYIEEEQVCEEKLIENEELMMLQEGAMNGNINVNIRCYAYASRPDVPVFNNLSFTLRKGEVTGLAGPSGSGKTTIVSLLLRLYDFRSLETNDVHISLDGEDLEKLQPTWLRQKVFSVVTQDAYLFTGTIRENIIYGLDDETFVTDAQIEEALKVASAYDFVFSLPEKLQFHFNAKSCGFSYGQRQRIVLARAILKNAPVLILDEATSGLDGDCEVDILNCLKKSLADKTTLIITHRPNSLKFADRILVVSDGSISDEGSFSDLMSRSLYFKQLVEGKFEHNLPVSSSDQSAPFRSFEA